jgi:hypothetical protein
MTRQAALWTVAAAFGCLALLAVLADHRRAKRRDLDKVGWVPWTAVQIASIIAAAAAVAVALRS